MAAAPRYLGYELSIDPQDTASRDFFRFCREHQLHLQCCGSCSRLRYPPSPGCPFCGSDGYAWIPVDGSGVIHSYTEVHHAVSAPMKPFVPYVVAIVELANQRDDPAAGAAIRIPGNLVTADGNLNLGDLQWEIDSPVRIVFSDVSDEIAIPLWTPLEASRLIS